MSIRGYRNNYGGVADYNVVFHFSYQNAVRKAINTWDKFDAKGALYKKAKAELITSYSKSLSQGDTKYLDHALRDPYARATDMNGVLIDGVKLHVKKKELHLSGLLIQKHVIIPGTYPNSNKSELSLVKDELMRMTSLCNYRQFKLVDGRFNSISVEKLTLNQKDLARKVS